MNRLFKVLCFTIVVVGMMLSPVQGSEDVLFEHLCETEYGGTSLNSGAPDGSRYYSSNGVVDLPGLERNSMDLLVWAVDIRFDQEGAGFTPMGTNGKWGTCIRSRTMNGRYQLVTQTGGSSYISYLEIDPNHWYHIELMGKYSAPDAHVNMLVWAYDENGHLTDLRIYDEVNMRNLWAGNNNGASFIKVEPNTSIDNVRIFRPQVDDLVLMAPANTLLSGQELQFLAQGSRFGINLSLEGAIHYEVFDSNNEHVLGNPNITIDDRGLLQVGQFVTDQDLHVRVVNADNTLSDAMQVSIKSNFMFDITSLGLNEEQTRIADLIVVKNFYYDGSAVCVIEISDDHGVLRDTVVRNISSSSILVKEPTKVPVGYELPSDYNMRTWQIKASIVSSID